MCAWIPFPIFPFRGQSLAGSGLAGGKTNFPFVGKWEEFLPTSEINKQKL